MTATERFLVAKVTFKSHSRSSAVSCICIYVGRNFLLAFHNKYVPILYSFRDIAKQGVALTGRNRTGPPCSVGRPTVQEPGRRRPTAHAPGPPTGRVTDDRRRRRQ